MKRSFAAPIYRVFHLLLCLAPAVTLWIWFLQHPYSVKAASFGERVRIMPEAGRTTELYFLTPRRSTATQDVFIAYTIRLSSGYSAARAEDITQQYPGLPVQWTLLSVPDRNFWDVLQMGEDLGTLTGTPLLLQPGMKYCLRFQNKRDLFQQPTETLASMRRVPPTPLPMYVEAVTLPQSAMMAYGIIAFRAAGFALCIGVGMGIFFLRMGWLRLRGMTA